MNIDFFKVNSKYPLSLGVVDDCLILSFPNIEKSEPYPGSYLEAIEKLFNILLDMNFNKWVLDLRNVKMIYNDLADLISLFPDNRVIAVSDDDQRMFLDADRLGTTVISPRLFTNNILFPPEFLIFLKDQLVLDDFFDEYPEWSNFNIDSATKGVQQVIMHIIKKQYEYKDEGFGIHALGKFDQYLDSVVANATSKLLTTYLNRLMYQSPLIQIAIQSIESHINCNILHSGAGYYTKTENSDIIITKPAIICNNTSIILNQQIIEFEYLLNNPASKENDFQNFFESNRNFLLGSEYEALYPQIVLEKDDGRMIPDFFLQPATVYPWADILDLKLPTEKLVVGSDRRRRLSHAVHEGIAQLREYEAYFENPVNRDKIYKTMGIRCYKPKLSLVIGRYTEGLNEMNVKREISSYQNLRILTYDDLLEHAKRMLLI